MQTLLGKLSEELLLIEEAKEVEREVASLDKGKEEDLFVKNQNKSLNKKS
jgi:hypothetical protein